MPTWGIIVSLPRTSWRPKSASVCPSISIDPPAASMIRNRARVSDDFPAPVRPTMPSYKDDSKTSDFQIFFILCCCLWLILWTFKVIMSLAKPFHQEIHCTLFLSEPSLNLHDIASDTWRIWFLPCLANLQEVVCEEHPKRLPVASKSSARILHCEREQIIIIPVQLHHIPSIAQRIPHSFLHRQISWPTTSKLVWCLEHRIPKVPKSFRLDLR